MLDVRSPVQTPLASNRWIDRQPTGAIAAEAGSRHQRGKVKIYQLFKKVS
jgi:hypothetical protein